MERRSAAVLQSHQSRKHAVGRVSVSDPCARAATMFQKKRSGEKRPDLISVTDRELVLVFLDSGGSHERGFSPKMTPTVQRLNIRSDSELYSLERSPFGAARQQMVGLKKKN